MEKLIDQSCRSFAGLLAAKKPVPGGGGASALVGGLGAALCAMVGNYTVNKPAYAAAQEDVQRLLAQAESISRRLLELVDEDAAAFSALSQAYEIPKDDPRRQETIEQSLRNAATPPMEILRLSCTSIELHQAMLERGNTMLLSDVGTGVIFCWGALYGSVLNVKVNTKLMADREYAQSLNREADALVEKYWKIAESVYESVMGRYA